VIGIEDFNRKSQSKQPANKNIHWPDTFTELFTAIELIFGKIHLLPCLTIKNGRWSWSIPSCLAVEFSGKFLGWPVDDNFEDPWDQKQDWCVDQENVKDSLSRIHAFSDHIFVSVSLRPVDNQNVNQVECVGNLAQKHTYSRIKYPLEPGRSQGQNVDCKGWHGNSNVFGYETIDGYDCVNVAPVVMGILTPYFRIVLDRTPQKDDDKKHTIK